MTGTEILGLVTGAYDILKTSVNRLFDYLSMGKVDKTEEMRLRSQIDLAAQQFQFSMKQAELWLAEKMLVGAKWTYPMAMITGCSIVAACLFNIVTRTMGWGMAVEVFSWEFIILIGMFLISATGSAEILIQVAALAVTRLKLVQDKAVKDGTGTAGSVQGSDSKTKK